MIGDIAKKEIHFATKLSEITPYSINSCRKVIHILDKLGINPLLSIGPGEIYNLDNAIAICDLASALAISIDDAIWIAICEDRDYLSRFGISSVRIDDVLGEIKRKYHGESAAQIESLQGRREKLSIAIHEINQAIIVSFRHFLMSLRLPRKECGDCKYFKEWRKNHD